MDKTKLAAAIYNALREQDGEAQTLMGSYMAIDFVIPSHAVKAAGKILRNPDLTEEQAAEEAIKLLRSDQTFNLEAVAEHLLDRFDFTEKPA